MYKFRVETYTSYWLSVKIVFHSIKVVVDLCSGNYFELGFRPLATWFR